MGSQNTSKKRLFVINNQGRVHLHFGAESELLSARKAYVPLISILRHFIVKSCLFVFFYSGWYFVHFWPSVLHNGMHGATQLWRWPKILLCRKFPRSLRGEVDVLQMINETSQHQTPAHLVASHQTKPDSCCFWSRSFVESQGVKMICRKKTCVQRALRVLSLLLWVCIVQELPCTSWLFHFFPFCYTVYRNTSF